MFEDVFELGECSKCIACLLFTLTLWVTSCTPVRYSIVNSRNFIVQRRTDCISGISHQRHARHLWHPSTVWSFLPLTILYLTGVQFSHPQLELTMSSTILQWPHANCMQCCMLTVLHALAIAIHTHWQMAWSTGGLYYIDSAELCTNVMGKEHAHTS